MMYKLLNKPTPSSIDCILRKNDDDSFTVIVCNEEAPDYQAYLAWREAGNEPEPADEA